MSHELNAFARAFFHGAVLLWIYDGLTIWRLARKSGRMAVDLRDLLFWIFAALYTFRYFYTVSSGSLRGYLFAGMLLGGLAWKYSLSPFYVGFGTKVLRMVGKVLDLPRKALKKSGKRLKFKLQKCRIKLYRPLRPIFQKRKEKKIKEDGKQRAEGMEKSRGKKRNGADRRTGHAGEKRRQARGFQKGEKYEQKKQKETVSGIGKENAGTGKEGSAPDEPDRGRSRNRSGGPWK